MQNFMRNLCRTYAELMQNLSGTFGVTSAELLDVYAELMPAAATCAWQLRTNGSLFILAAVRSFAVKW